jgi:DNA modification methylase
MMTLNAAQSAKGREMHLCPMQFDLADRVIAQYTMEGETVLDPFGGLMTVPYRALKLKRKAIGIELNRAYILDGAKYCEAAAREVAMPSLFDIPEMIEAQPDAEDIALIAEVSADWIDPEMVE